MTPSVGQSNAMLPPSWLEMRVHVHAEARGDLSAALFRR
jgi:hypothetical protein